MKKVLCGWEFGAGLGHLTRLKRLALALREEGSEIVLATQDLDKATMFLSADGSGALPGISVVPSPRWTMPTDPKARQIPTHSFADVLNIIGYGNEAALAMRLEAWVGLIRATGADLVIGDFAPTLMLAARGRVPSVMVGNGYTIPPAGRPLPPIRPWQKQLEPFSREHEATLLGAVNTVRARRGETAIEHFADILNGDETFVFSIPLVDPYAEYRSEPALPPFNMPTGLTPKPIDARRRKGVFFYMPRGHNDLRKAVDAVKAAGVDAEGYISELPRDRLGEVAGPGFRLHPDPQPFDRVLPDARLIIHHGGLSTAVAAVLAGTPQLVLPWNLEHLVTARRVETLKTSVVTGVGEDWPVKKLSGAIKKLVDDRAILIRAQHAAGRLEVGDPEAGLRQAVARCRALAG